MNWSRNKFQGGKKYEKGSVYLGQGALEAVPCGTYRLRRDLYDLHDQRRKQAHLLRRPSPAE